MKSFSPESNLFKDEFLFDDATRYEPDSPPLEAITVPRDLASYPEEIQAEVSRRLAYLKWIEKRLEGCWTQARLEPLLQQATAEIAGEAPNWRTLVKWRKYILTLASCCLHCRRRPLQTLLN